eukprot:PhF_6_TR12294/c0_g1_i1/m.19514
MTGTSSSDSSSSDSDDSSTDSSSDTSSSYSDDFEKEKSTPIVQPTSQASVQSQDQTVSVPNASQTNVAPPVEVPPQPNNTGPPVVQPQVPPTVGQTDGPPNNASPVSVPANDAVIPPQATVNPPSGPSVDPSAPPPPNVHVNPNDKSNQTDVVMKPLPVWDRLYTKSKACRYKGISQQQISKQLRDDITRREERFNDHVTALLLKNPQRHVSPARKNATHKNPSSLPPSNELPTTRVDVEVTGTSLFNLAFKGDVEGLKKAFEKYTPDEAYAAVRSLGNVKLDGHMLGIKKLQDKYVLGLGTKASLLHYAALGARYDTFYYLLHKLDCDTSLSIFHDVTPLKLCEANGLVLFVKGLQEYEATKALQKKKAGAKKAKFFREES